jgi:thermitase
MQRVDLVWTGAQSTTVDLYRNGAIVLTTPNDSRETDEINKRGNGTYSYKICDMGTANCSNVVTVTF